MGDKLYVVTHRELEPGYQAVQSQHALFQFSIEHAEAARRWYAFSNYLGFLSVENETALLELLDAAITNGIRVSAFHEPDIGGNVTAIALEASDASSRLVSQIPLALKGAKEK